MPKRERYKVAKSIENKYNTLIGKLIKPIEQEAMKYVGDRDKFNRVLRNATNSPTYKNKVNQVVKEIATMIYEENARDWREAAFKGSKGNKVRRKLEKEVKSSLEKRMKELIDYNTTLITTLPESISEAVTHHINTESFKGKRASEIAEEIKRFFPHHTKAKAELIARTECSKFSSALTQARAEDLGIDWYEWNTSEDGSVRSSHRIMDKVLVNYKHPPVPERLDKKLKLKKYPAPYHAGNIYNCRCYAAPLTELSDVKFPHKVYNWKKKKIEMMTLGQFKKFAGINK